MGFLGRRFKEYKTHQSAEYLGEKDTNGLIRGTEAYQAML
jgi:hypothetical protein